MKPVAPLGLIRPLALRLGRTGRRWRGGPLVPMIWRRRAPARTVRGEPGSMATRFAPTYIFNLSLAWPAGTANRVETLRTQLAAQTGRDRAARRPAGPAERLWTRLEKTVLHFADPGEAVPMRREAAEVLPRRAPAPLLPRLTARARARIAAAPPRSVPAPRATAVRLQTGKAEMRPIAEARPRGQPPAALVARAPAALIWRREIASGGTAAAASALPGATARRGAELVWRRPAPAEASSEGRAAPEAASPRAAPAPAPAAWRGEAQGAPGHPMGPSAIPPVEMGRLVDEVVRRLDRIGRDERLRRGV
jgi:hypothetical protein